ncbi:unnamed protein product [Ambrosiozyma monospora]|uniref:Unnamed protein product n=1 Tax=Ambrosiozyma monospora TaxID=43982 RepID=A0ACB5TN71_AMBMO|nr:unnamed protein product [Ambrosiozyma monospora]
MTEEQISVLSTGVSGASTPAPEPSSKENPSSLNISTNGNSYNVSQFPGSHFKPTSQERKEKYIVKDEKKYFDVNATAARFGYLLGLTQLFRHFIDSKAEKDPKFKQVLDILQSGKKTSKKSNDHRRRKTEQEEDAELLRDEEDDDTSAQSFEFTDSPAYINGKLRPYQIQGLNWLISLHTNNLSGILADEMGLGKTLQTISFLGYLRYIKSIQGPHLVIVPKSTLDNWQREFAKWTPEVSTVILTGDQQQRNEIIKDRILECDFDVVISSYEIVIREKSSLKKIDWDYGPC